MFPHTIHSGLYINSYSQKPLQMMVRKRIVMLVKYLHNTQGTHKPSHDHLKKIQAPKQQHPLEQSLCCLLHMSNVF